jgi:CHAT domain-containing protein
MTADLSVADSYAARCRLCATAFEARIWRIVDLDARPVLEADLKDGSLQRSFCPVCIGPGVERLGAIAIVATGSDGRSRTYFVFEPETAQEALAALDRRFSDHCTECGVDPATILVGGSGLADSMAEIGVFLDRGGISLRGMHVERLKPALDLVFATDCEARRAILMANPDLVRPATIGALAAMPDLDPKLSRVQVRPILALLTAASRHGIDAAIARCVADDRWLQRLRSLPGPIAEAYYACLPDNPQTIAQLEFSAANAETFLADNPQLQDDLLPHLAMALGGAWSNLGVTAGDPARRHAIYWFERVLASATVTPRMQVDALLGLSACRDQLLGGDPLENSRLALQHAEAAADLAADQSDEDMALAQTDLGIARMNQRTGDPFVNSALAREAFTLAQAPGAAPVTRWLATYNAALSWIEEGSGDIVEKIAIGIAMLESIEEEAGNLFNTAQQQNFYQSLGAARLRHGGLIDSLADFSAAADAFATALDLARREGRDGARLLFLHTAAEAEQLIRGATARPATELLATLDAIQRTYDAATAPGFFIETERLRALLLERCPPPGTPDNAALLARRSIVAAQHNGVELVDAWRLATAEERRGPPGLVAAAAAFALAADAAEGQMSTSSTLARLDEEIADTTAIYFGLVRTQAALACAGKDNGFDVLASMERGRARDLLDALGRRNLPAPAGVPPALVAEEAELRSALELEPVDTISASFGDKDRKMSQREGLRNRLGQLHEVIAAASDAGAAYVALRRPLPPDADALRRLVAALPEHDGILAFWLAPAGTIAVLARPGTPPLVLALDFTEAEANAVLTTLHAQVATPQADTLTTSPLWRAAGARLLAPFAAAFSACRRLTIVPHGRLHNLPLHALPFAADEPLIAKLETVTIPSLGIMRDLMAATRPHGTLTASVLCSAKNPAERASFTAEATNVAALLGTSAIEDARRADLLGVGTTANILHIVCHGRFDDENPLAAALALADGLVSVEDLVTTRLRASLVCLAACETGLLGIASGDRLAGLRRALLLAGAGATVTTLWNIWSEPTRFWVEHFYRALVNADGSFAPLSFAHQAATLATRRRHPHPLHWAPFVLSGHDRLQTA